jgi:hypothetical protein
MVVVVIVVLFKFTKKNKKQKTKMMTMLASILLNLLKRNQARGWFSFFIQLFKNINKAMVVIVLLKF